MGDSDDNWYVDYVDKEDDMPDVDMALAYEFYSNPANLEVQGPGRRRRQGHRSSPNTSFAVGHLRVLFMVLNSYAHYEKLLTLKDLHAQPK